MAGRASPVKTTPATLLGLYPDAKAGLQGLRLLRQAGFRRSAIVDHTAAGRLVVEGQRHEPFRWIALILGALDLLFIALGVATGQIAGRTLLSGDSLAVVVFPLLIASLLVAHWRSVGVPGDLIDRYKRWVMPSETLVIALAPLPRAGAVLEIMRRAGEPATFVLREQSRPGAGLPTPPRERFTAERLDLHAAQLAARQRVGRSARRRYLLMGRLDLAERVIEEITTDLTTAVRLEQGTSLSAEWLLDNAYVVQRHCGDVRRNLSRRFYDVLPVLDAGPHAGEPRVYELALEFVDRAEAEVYEDNLVAFVRAYQEISPLTIGELWVLPLMLRLALVEQLYRLALEVDRYQREHELADFWANRLLSATRRASDHLIQLIAELARVRPDPSPYVVDRLVSQLQGEPDALDALRAWLERKLGATLAEIRQQEQRRHLTTQATIANAIRSLRELSRLDWREVFEELSVVERVLREDPSGVYPVMEFASRDYYRTVVEQVARRSPTASEVDVARTAVELARAARVSNPSDERRSHVGYYLVDAGRSALEARAHYSPSFPVRARDWALSHPVLVYVGAIALETLVVVGLDLAGAGVVGRGFPLVMLLALATLAALPASEVAAQAVNTVITRLIAPRHLPKLAFDAGIPPEWRTLVVVPTLLLTPATIRDDLERLEVRYLANPDPNLHFALLADFPDAPTRRRPRDDELLALAVDGIDALNRRHGSHFSLFYRERVWSETEQVWMGWERKRGKLEALNRWLVEGEADARSGLIHVGERDAVRGVRCVLTLDADTQLPPGAARRLVGTLAHPLNRPIVAPDGERVIAGYGIIQPRVSPSLPSATASRFARLIAGPVGTDPYTHLVSDLYHDLAGEASYLGKGIYDLAAFHRVLGGRFPEATLLSHDLLEGAYVRCGLASDVELFEEIPSRYAAYLLRQHRWIRGDWQIAAWCGPSVPRAGGGRTKNPLSAINRWKIFDNLRRSLVPPGSLALLLAGWLLWPSEAWAWTTLAALPLLLPAIIRTATALTTPAEPGSARLTPLRWYWRRLRETGVEWTAALFWGCVLPIEAATSLDAIARVWWRKLISHRRLLEWQTALMAHVNAREHGRRFAAVAVGVSLGSVAGAGALLDLTPTALPGAAPFLLAWILAPLLVREFDTPTQRRPSGAITVPDRGFLRRIARRTWRYFDDFVGPDSHWLPPDNFQAALRVEVAPRTSPTNVGLWLLATVAANDLGYLTPDRVVELGRATLETLRQLDRFQGHLLNWYDLRTLQPLTPRYVSTVDSGNLLACLWTLQQSYDELLSRPILGPAALQGLEDTLDLIQEALVSRPLDDSLASDTGQISDLTRALSILFEEPPDHLAEIIRRLRAAATPASELARALERRQARHAAAGSGDDADEEVYWARQLERQIASWLDVVQRYFPWVETLSALAEKLPAPAEPDKLEPWRSVLGHAPSLAALASGDYAARLAECQFDSVPGEALAEQLRLAGERAAETVRLAQQVSTGYGALVRETNLRFLYDPARRLFSLGYNLELRRLDPSYYDLLASEARLASFVAIARGETPVEHWLTLGRPFGVVEGRPVLLSWTGTMFEYLMPQLLMPSYEGSLLDAACREAVAAQIDYGARRGIPWGISESAFSAVDAQQIYQYQAFGVPGLGLKRGLADDLVVAPYATALALMVEPGAAVSNLKRLVRLGARGAYGFYDAIDFTPRRSPAGQEGVIVATYMAHHQGMTLLALDNVLNQHVLRSRFRAEPAVQAVEALLYERTPLAPPVIAGTVVEAVPARPTLAGGTSPGSGGGTRFRTPDTHVPRAHLLSNGTYTVMITGSGAGYSRWRDVDVSRWRSDTTRDSWGSFFYLRDVDQNWTWSATFQPIRRQTSHEWVTFKPDRVEFERRDGGIVTLTEVVVSPEDDVEIRRLTFVNHDNRPHRLELTSYVELALAAPEADRAHPAFSKLFVRTEAVPDRPALLAHRKPRRAGELPIWALHALVGPDGPEGATRLAVTYETDRAAFLGRGRDVHTPASLDRPLTRSSGSVLDPIFSLRCSFSLRPGERLTLAFVTGAAESRELALGLVGKFQDLRAVERAFELAAYQAQLELRHLRITAEDLDRFQTLASHMLYPNDRLRAAELELRQNRLGQSRLWAYGISGDLPIMLVSIGDRRDAELVSQALSAHTFWRRRGFKSDLVILDEEASSYEQPLRTYLRTLVQAYAQYSGIDQPGGIFLRSTDQMPSEDLALLRAAARVVLVASRGPLAQQLSPPPEVQLPRALATPLRVVEEPSPPLPFLELPYFNGIGGFTREGKEYAIYLGPNVTTPAPWVNVMANPSFGALVSESGQGFAWYGNSQANRLLPWSNDPVSDPCGDAIYLRDEETGRFWTPTSLPVRELDAYRARHGQGYTIFEHNSHAIEQILETFVPVDDGGGVPVRVQRLRLRNSSSRRRSLSVTFYAEWVLGGGREESQMHVVSSWDAESQALLARNAYHPDYGSRVAFASASLAVASYTADRTEFLGRTGSATRPAALRRQSLARRVGAGLDPCAALQVRLELEPNQEAEVTFLLGQTADAARARNLVRRYRDPEEVERALRTTQAWWDALLATIQVETPDLATNLLLNRWLLYQTLSCRVWARSAFYQSGGAFGFRDQLQDVMALVYAAPSLARQHILVAAARQFPEGDVQHWWHPQSGGGVRTRISDDLLWLPYVTAHYVDVTGDVGILDESVPFLEGHPLEEHEHERYFVPTASLDVGTLLEHCRRAIAHASTRGPHGLPLIGGGDWNDGLNLVGIQGKGESVWLAWFLIEVLRRFAGLLERIGQAEPAAAYRDQAARLIAAVEAAAWDGEWYRRAYFDDGTPLGSRENVEAFIDSLPQSWAAITGAGDPGRVERALRAVDDYLVRKADRLILLFTPPFDRSPLNPGYVKGYPPGVRENGGHYTHAAVWLALAWARRGDGDRAVQLLRMLGPIERARTPEEMGRYQVEPYVVAADVYSLEGRVGRGGWTWYTGSSGWLYRVWLEEVLGFHLRGDHLEIEPVIPSEWPGYSIVFKRRSACYRIVVENPERVSRGVVSVEVDGQRAPEGGVVLSDAGDHLILVRLGQSSVNGG